ncbi:hypothetical protein QJS10_CPB13g00246 [Acorus calamus]|uniref:Uncharacterized protein n=1 Tax=Acorus calamus TaxID=4465 RepID=A0AAV9DGE8_ACOCL|nr:hypothetical protein QJS10_CPB13g00246 [Acorus calamus]
MNKFLFWNTRGLNARTKQLDVKNLLAKHNCDFIALLETKLQPAQAQHIARFIFPNSSFHINPSGRIFILWNPNSLQIQITAESTQFCHCEVTHLKEGSSMDITAVYASIHPTIRQRGHFFGLTSPTSNSPVEDTIG